MQPFEAIVDEHGAVVLRVLRSSLGRADAEDAWSETFLAALRAYPRLRPDSNVRGWLITIAHRKAIDLVRARRATPVPPEHLASPATSNIPEPANDELAAALATLTARQRDAVVYHHVAGLSYAEVGELLGSNEVAARRSAADGLAKLRNTYPGGAT